MNDRTNLMVGWGLAIALGAWTACAAQESGNIVGYSIAQKDPGNEYGQSYVPGTQAGVQIYLRVSLPENAILKVDGEATSFTVKDSTGNELDANENSDIGFFASVAEDQHSVILPVQCTELPAKGSTFLTIAGKATLSCGADAKTEAVDIQMEQDAVVSAGPITAKITQLGDGFEPDSTRVEFEGGNAMEQLEKLVFLDSAGKELETTSAGGGSFGFGGEMTYTKAYQFKGKPEQVAKVRISYFQKKESVEVPVEAKFGLDLNN